MPSRRGCEERTMDRTGIRLFSVVILQFLLLAAVIGYKGYTVVTGETVLLKTEPVDPRSLFSGDYVALRYEISTLDMATLSPDEFIGPRRTVYVTLARGDDGYWHAVHVSTERGSVANGQALIKGRTERGSVTTQWGTVRVEYGIENVFVPEGSGRAVESGQRDLGVEVKVDRFGNAVPRGLVVDGERLKLERR
jgi:uncharacterized membrane-anchored protein